MTETAITDRLKALGEQLTEATRQGRLLHQLPLDEQAAIHLRVHEQLMAENAMSVVAEDDAYARLRLALERIAKNSADDWSVDIATEALERADARD